MKVLPIKLPDEMYEDLKTVSVSDGMPMAEVLREYLRNSVTPKAQKIRKKSQAKQKAADSFFERMKKHIYTGPTYLNDLTDDEILYGGKLGDY